MQEKEQTSKQYFKSLKLIHIALMIGQVSFASVAFLINSLEPIAMTELNDTFLILVAVFTLGSLAAGKLVAKNKLKAAKQKQTLSEKLDDYRVLIITKLALLELPVFFAIVSFILTSNLTFLGLSGLVLIIFIIQAPTQDKLIDDLELTYAEKTLIEDPESNVVTIKITQS